MMTHEQKLDYVQSLLVVFTLGNFPSPAKRQVLSVMVQGLELPNGEEVLRAVLDRMKAETSADDFLVPADETAANDLLLDCVDLVTVDPANGDTPAFQLTASYAARLGYTEQETAQLFQQSHAGFEQVLQELQPAAEQAPAADKPAGKTRAVPTSAYYEKVFAAVAQTGLPDAEVATQLLRIIRGEVAGSAALRPLAWLCFPHATALRPECLMTMPLQLDHIKRGASPLTELRAFLLSVENALGAETLVPSSPKQQKADLEAFHARLRS